MVLEELEQKLEEHYAILMKVDDKSNPYMGHVGAVAVAVAVVDAVARDTSPVAVIERGELLVDVPNSL
jgi:hypothetical protein